MLWLADTIPWSLKAHLYYKGFENSVINYDEDLESWVLTSLDGIVNGTSLAAITNIGTGAMTWQFDRDICLTNSLEPLQVVITDVKINEPSLTGFDDGV